MRKKNISLKVKLLMVLILICLSFTNFVNAYQQEGSPSLSESEPSDPQPSANQPVPQLVPHIESQLLPFTGSFITTIGLQVPPGTNGLQPDLNLIYDSNGGPGWCGKGWDLSIGMIKRDTKDGIPRYNNTDTFIFSIKGTTQELVSIGNNKYGAQIESNFMKFVFENNIWYVWDKSGTKYIFGSNVNSQITKPNNSQVYSWCLDEIIDSHGNYMTISYTKDQEQLYPDEIKYTGNKYLKPVRLIKFKVANRPDVMSDYHSSFKITTAKRLESIEMWVNNEFVRRYELKYYDKEELTNSLLKSVKQIGDDKVSSLPETKFEYQNGVAGWMENANWEFPEVFVKGIDDQGVRLADVNGDGLTDIIKASKDVTTTSNLYINNGSGWRLDKNWKFPEAFVWGTIDQGVRLTDVNGDGLIDVIRANTWGLSTTRKIYINNGSGWEFNNKWIFPTGEVFVDNKRNTGIQLTDINGDGLVDVVRANTWNGKPTKRVYINNGQGWTLNTDRSQWELPEIFVWGTRDTGTRLVDVNGDGLVDIVRGDKYSTTPTQKVYINNGSNWVVDPEWGFPELFVAGDKEMGVRLADINGDGLVDIIRALSWVDDETPSDNDISKAIYINNGHGWDLTSNWEFPEIFVAAKRDKGVLLDDVNGDGLIDIIRANIWYDKDGKEITTKRIFIKNGKEVDKALKVTNPLGGITSIIYKSSTSFVNKLLPFPIHVVGSITTNNGMGNLVKISYAYSGGYYDFQTREFLGFGQVKATDTPGNYKVSYFLQEQNRHNNGRDSVNIFKGKLYKQESCDSGGKILQKQDNTWQSKSIQPYGTTKPIFFPYISRIEQEDSNLNNVDKKSSAIEYEYDKYGNVTKIANLGNTSITGDERYDLIEYTYSDNDRGTNTTYLVNLPSRRVTSNTPGDTAKLTETLYFYDGASNRKNNEPINGNLTKKEEWLDRGNRYLTTNMDYDTYGNVIKLTDPRGNSTTTDYDSLYYTYPEKITNAKGHIYTSTYDPKFGVVLTETDPNQVTTYYRYDQFGRLKKVVGPYDGESQPTVEYVYNLSGTAPNETIAYQRINHGESETLDMRTFTDGLGRTIRIQKPASQTGKNVISDEVNFNNRGLVERRYLPYLADSGSAGFSQTTYDALGRVTRIDNPDGTNTRTNYYTWQEEQYDANGNRHKYIRDAYRRIIKVEEYNGSDTYITTYTYDTLDQLTKIVNSLNPPETTTIAYDSLGRKTQMTDPKMGTWKYDYDNNDNLTWQKDNKGDIITMTYDQLNRILSKTYPSGKGITYVYDNASPGLYGLSRLDRVDDASGRTSFEYDQLGQITKTVKKIDGKDYTTEFSYNALGQQTRLIYPDEEREAVDYTYTNGFLQAVASRANNYLNAITYQASGQIANLAYGNGITTQYTYNPQNLRLTALKTFNTKTTLQEFSYNYDKVGNILRITDSENTATQIFNYDTLNRLTKGMGIGTYSQKYEYDSVGNLTMVFSGLKRVPQDYPTIQSAINSSQEGDIINVSPGTYTEHITLKQGVIVQSTNGPAVTIIDGAGTPGPVVQAINSETETTVLRGFSITGGSGKHPGILCHHSSPTIMHNIIKNNRGSGGQSRGGGISLYYSSAVIMYNIIEANTADYGGGIFCDDYWYSQWYPIHPPPGSPLPPPPHYKFSKPQTPKIIGNKISGNTATRNPANAGAGGGIYCHYSNAEIIQNIIENNKGQFGGGVYVYGVYNPPSAYGYWYTIEPKILDNTIKNNEANYGGGIFCDGEVKPQITNNVIRDNKALRTSQENEMGGGGGIYVYESDPIITDNQIIHNLADFYGGGIYCYNASAEINHNKIYLNAAGIYGGGIFCDDNGSGLTVSITENQIKDNGAREGAGGGIYVHRTSVKISNNRITDNGARDYGGGIYCFDASVTINNNQITGNATVGYAGGMFCDNEVGGKITNNVFSYNAASHFGGGIFINNSSLDLTNNIISNNTLNSPGGAGQEIFVSPPFTLTTTYNNIHHNLPPQLAYLAYYGWQPTTGDVNVDPRFQDVLNSDYHLKDSSLCLNWGDPNPSYNDPNGTRNDMGNYGGPEAKIILKAEAGEDQTTAVNTEVILDGTWSSYPNGVSLFSAQWTQIEGETVSLNNATNLEAKFKPIKEGAYVFKLTITADGKSISDEITIWAETDFIPPYSATMFEGKNYTDLTYDANGNMTQIGGRQIAYDYENRPTMVIMPGVAGKVITYTYDYTGQRVKKEVRDKDKQEQKLTQQAEKLEKAGQTRLAEVIEKAMLQLALSKSKKPSPPKPPKPGPKPTPGVVSEVTYYIGNLYEVQSSSITTITTKYVYANGTRVAVARVKGQGSREIQYYHSDHLGSSNIITDSVGNKVQLLEYVPFGETRLSQGTASVEYKFTGQMLDNDAGLYYYGARWYEPVVGKFITPDFGYPITIDDKKLYNDGEQPNNNYKNKYILYDPQMLNRYAYCRNNPMNMTDPEGLLTILIHGTWSGPSTFSEDFINTVRDTFSEKKEMHLFEWSGKNTDTARKDAANELADYINNYEFAEGEKLNIVGHSHGGNVAIIASNYDLEHSIDNLVTLGTPMRSDSEYSPNMNNISRLFNVYSSNDPVQNKGGDKYLIPSLGEIGPADRTITNIKVTNLMVHEDKGWGTHSFLYSRYIWDKYIRIPISKK